MNKIFCSQVRRREAARLLLLTLWLTISLTIIGLGLWAAMLWYMASPLSLDEAFAGRYSVPANSFYLYQPGKTLAFETGCLAVPFLLGISYFLTRRVIGLDGSFFLPLLSGLGLGLSWLFFLWCLVPLISCPDPPYPPMPPQWLLFIWFFQSHSLAAIVRFYFVVVMVGLSLFFWWRQSSRQNLNMTLAMLVLEWAVVVPAHLYAPAEIDDDWRFTHHFNIILHALSQVANGHHLLVDFPHVYGGYIEILGPVLFLFPRCIETPLLVFAGLKAMAVLGLLVTARLVIRQPLVLFLTGLGLLGIEFVMTVDDHYYQYYAIRMIFPSLGLLAATLYLRKPSRLKYGAISLLTAVASVWNFDTGLVLWSSWTLTLMAREFGVRSFMNASRHFGMQTAILAVTWTAFFST